METVDDARYRRGMAIASAARPDIGDLLRHWRQRRHLSQLELGTRAEVSTRHLSFVETGRSRPSRELVLHLAEHLEVPLRSRNDLLLAAGYAPAYRETALDDPAMDAVRAAVRMVLSAQSPYPALAFDRLWNLVDANDGALVLLDGVDPALLTPPVNVLRVSLHPDGLASRLENSDEVARHLLDRLARQVERTADPDLSRLQAELVELAGLPDGRDVAVPPEVVLPVRLRWRDTTLTLFSTVSVFGTPVDITTSELAIESFFPADEATAQALGTLRA